MLILPSPSRYSIVKREMDWTSKPRSLRTPCLLSHVNILHTFLLNVNLGAKYNSCEKPGTVTNGIIGNRPWLLGLTVSRLHVMLGMRARRPQHDGLTARRAARLPRGRVGLVPASFSPWPTG